jgi:hypothetical protein
MSESDELRKRAAQLFALALKARDTGFASVTELEKLAAESLALAEEMERKARPSPVAEAPQQPAQQQQQPQPPESKKE